VNLNNKPVLNRRPGTATVELALCLPLIVLVAMGAIEGASLIFLKQNLTQSAYEGAKLAILPGTTNADVERATQQVLVGRTLDNARVETNPVNIASARRGDLIIVRVVAPSDSNSLFPFGIFSTRNVAGTAVMARE
jgi:Flp pilus assembly protein TadG